MEQEEGQDPKNLIPNQQYKIIRDGNSFFAKFLSYDGQYHFDIDGFESVIPGNDIILKNLLRRKQNNSATISEKSNKSSKCKLKHKEESKTLVAEEEEESCIICLEKQSLEKGELFKDCLCNNSKMHSKCGNKWYKINHNCPQCRRVLPNLPCKRKEEKEEAAALAAVETYEAKAKAEEEEALTALERYEAALSARHKLPNSSWIAPILDEGDITFDEGNKYPYEYDRLELRNDHNKVIEHGNKYCVGTELSVYKVVYGRDNIYHKYKKIGRGKVIEIGTNQHIQSKDIDVGYIIVKFDNIDKPVTYINKDNDHVFKIEKVSDDEESRCTIMGGYKTKKCKKTYKKCKKTYKKCKKTYKKCKKTYKRRSNK
jgi:hypothetical protein